VLAKQAAHLSEGERDLILHDNVAELYGLERP
jgi:predicted TIM-barrel fold metal-dependent hydrolase